MKRLSVNIILPPVALLLLCLSSCTENYLEDDRNIVRFEVSSSNPDSRASLYGMPDWRYEGSYSLGLKDNLEYGGIYRFQSSAFDGESPFFDVLGSEFANLETVDYSNTEGWKMSREYYWPDDTELTFFAYANMPADGASVTMAPTGATLNYTLGTFESQTDILLGSYKGKGGGTGTATINFCHPFSAIYVMDYYNNGCGFTDNDKSIKKIVIEGLASKGTVVLDGNGALCEWTVDDDDYNGTLTQTSDESGFYTYIEGTHTLGAPFLIIPQQTSQHQMTIRLETTEGEKYKAVLDSFDFLPGEIHLVRVSLKGIAVNQEPAIIPWTEAEEAVGVEVDTETTIPYVEIAGLRWATCNLGSIHPQDRGVMSTFANNYGYIPYDIQYYSYYGYSGCKWYSDSYEPDVLPDFNQYENTPGYSLPDVSSTGSFNDEGVDPDYDIVRKKLGNPWRLPTKEDFESLLENTDWEYDSGDKGYYVYGKSAPAPHDKLNALLFFPFEGYGYYSGSTYYLSSPSSLKYDGTSGYYQTSSHNGSYSIRFFLSSSTKTFEQVMFIQSSGYAYSVRPVSDIID